MSTTDSTTSLKRCSRGDKCVHPAGCLQPATEEAFGLHKTRGKLRSECKACRKEDKRRYLAEHAEEHREYNRRHYMNNRDRYRERSRQRRLENCDEIRERKRRYRAENTQKRHAYDREWRTKNRGKRVVSEQRRRARKYELPDTFTIADWHTALDYFNGCCAVCGRQLYDLFGTLAANADHWIPMSSPKCPGTVAINIIPLCGGDNGCNQSKSDKEPNLWLVERFGKRRAREILKRIEAYFEWVGS